MTAVGWIETVEDGFDAAHGIGPRFVVDNSGLMFQRKVFSWPISAIVTPE